MRAPVVDYPVADTAALLEAVRTKGYFYARHPWMDESGVRQALALAQSFFALPDEAKRRVAIKGSPHFRGYSEMRNERDWREQIHFGREEPAGALVLRGPNLWPAGADWRSELERLLETLEAVGREILGSLAASLGAPPDHWMPATERPYLLLKLIHYLTVPSQQARSGVAPHVDFSWITLLLQDDTGGLEVCTPDGRWLEVAPLPGTLVVNVGEILQLMTGGCLAATPHRVVSRGGARLSLPFFLNPALDRWLHPPPRSAPTEEPEEAVHVHRVLAMTESRPLCFGDAERRRKVEGIWCRRCCLVSAAEAPPD